MHFYKRSLIGLANCFFQKHDDRYSVEILIRLDTIFFTQMYKDGGCDSNKITWDLEKSSTSGQFFLVRKKISQSNLEKLLENVIESQKQVLSESITYKQCTISMNQRVS